MAPTNMSTVLRGTVVTFDRAQPVVQRGAVYVDDQGMLEAVQPAGDAAPVGYTSANVVETKGVIYPGLIDLHGHMAYHHHSLWVPPKTEPYTTRYRWSGGEDYYANLVDPTTALAQVAGKALLKYV